MNTLAQNYLNRIKRNMPVHKADDDLIQEFLKYAKGTDTMEVIALLLNSILTLDSKLTVANSKLKLVGFYLQMYHAELTEDIFIGQWFMVSHTIYMIETWTS